ncbi:MAG: hypothetical protein WC967_15635 [Balneolaceae bacterium]
MNIKVVDFTKFKSVEIVCWQYDYGQKIELIGENIDLQTVVQWSYDSIEGIDSKLIYEENEKFYSEIPDEALALTTDFKGYIFVSDSEKGNTTYLIKGRIRPRAPITE